MYCFQCGTKLPDDVNFCSNCGQSLKTVFKIPSENEKAKNHESALIVLLEDLLRWKLSDIKKEPSFSWMNCRNAYIEIDSLAPNNILLETVKKSGSGWTLRTEPELFSRLDTIRMTIKTRTWEHNFYIFEVTFITGPRSGSGSDYVVMRQNNKWEIEQGPRFWDS